MAQPAQSALRAKNRPPGTPSRAEGSGSGSSARGGPVRRSHKAPEGRTEPSWMLNLMLPNEADGVRRHSERKASGAELPALLEAEKEAAVPWAV